LPKEVEALLDMRDDGFLGVNVKGIVSHPLWEN
jgi:hypothetical protein